MAKKKRCNLCGAKLKGDICSECGYNNAAYNYKVNVSQDDCTHSSSETFYSGKEHQEHTDPDVNSSSVDSWDYSHLEEMLGEEYSEKHKSVLKEEPMSFGMGEKKPEKRKKRKWIKWLILIWLIPTVVELIAGLLYRVMESDVWMQVEELFTEEIPDDREPPQENRSDTPESAVQGNASGESEEPAMTAAGESYRTKLGPGIYMAGLHIPAGSYDAELISGSGSFYAQNMEENYWESDYMYERSNKNEQKLEKLQLTPGTMVKITDDLWMELTTEESQGYLADTEGWENTLTDPVTVSDGMTAGEEFPAGTYCLSCTLQEQGMAALFYKYTDYSGTEDCDQIIFSEGADRFENITFSEGDILMKLNCDIVMTPAEFDLSDTLVW